MTYCIGGSLSSQAAGTQLNKYDVTIPTVAAQQWQALTNNWQGYSRSDFAANGPALSELPASLQSIAPPIASWFHTLSSGALDATAVNLRSASPVILDLPTVTSEFQPALYYGSSAPTASAARAIVANSGRDTIRMMRSLSNPPPPPPPNLCENIGRFLPHSLAQAQQECPAALKNVEEAYDGASENLTASYGKNITQDLQYALTAQSLIQQAAGYSAQFQGTVASMAVLDQEQKKSCGGRYSSTIAEITSMVSEAEQQILPIVNSQAFTLLQSSIAAQVSNLQALVAAEELAAAVAQAEASAGCIQVNAQWYGFDMVLNESCTQDFLGFLQTATGSPSMAAILAAWASEILAGVQLAIGNVSAGTVVNFLKALLSVCGLTLQEDMKNRDHGSGVTLHVSLLAAGVATLLSQGVPWPAVLIEEGVLTFGGGGGFLCELYQLLWISTN
jgi:hypothetical protein